MSVPTPRRPWSLQVYALIDAGTTDLEEIIRLATPYVPQGHAYRARERRNGGFRQRYNAQVRQLGPRPCPPAQVHRVGARMVILKTIRDHARDGRLVIEDGHVRRAQ